MHCPIAKAYIVTYLTADWHLVVQVKLTACLGFHTPTGLKVQGVWQQLSLEVGSTAREMAKMLEVLQNCS